MVCFWRVSLGIMVAAAIAACGVSTSSFACRRDPATYALECRPSFSGIGGLAAVLPLAIALQAWKGCTINGCELPNRCNQATKLCEPIRCSETQTCPTGYRCMHASQLCR
jgi:hypothetical protein